MDFADKTLPLRVTTSALDGLLANANKRFWPDRENAQVFRRAELRILSVNQLALWVRTQCKRASVTSNKLFRLWELKENVQYLFI